jgi:hypothetical protein
VPPLPVAVDRYQFFPGGQSGIAVLTEILLHCQAKLTTSTERRSFTGCSASNHLVNPIQHRRVEVTLAAISTHLRRDVLDQIKFSIEPMLFSDFARNGLAAAAIRKSSFLR